MEERYELMLDLGDAPRLSRAQLGRDSDDIVLAMAEDRPRKGMIGAVVIDGRTIKPILDNNV